MLFTAISTNLTFSGLLVCFSFGAGTATFSGGLSCAHGSESALKAYVFVFQGRNTSVQINTHGSDGRDLSSLKAKYGAAFLWFCLDGKDYVIQDPATLGKVQNLFRPEEKLDHQEEVLDKQEEELERRQEAIEGKQEHLEERMEQLDEKEEALEDGASRAGMIAQRKSLESELAALRKELLPLEQQQKKLSQQQEELGRAQEQASREAERGLQNLMTESIRSGLAQRVDRAGSALKR